MCRSWLLSMAAVALAAPALGGSHYRYVHLPEANFYFGHVSDCELLGDDQDPHVLRAEGTEPASVNLPLAPGDRILTTPGRRCEIQFDTGTILRLDGDTGLRIETILARALSTHEQLTNLHLELGRVHILYRDYDSSEVFQVMTPNAAVKLSRAAVVDVELTEAGETRVAVQRGSAAVLYGPRADKTRTRKLKAGQLASVAADHELVLAKAVPAGAGDAFAAWNREMNERFVERHQGKSVLPKPLYRYPRAVVEFAQRFSDPYGEWMWSELYGYVWRPYLRQDEAWRPYLLGRWVPMNGRLFWVPQEPWGWVPYHLGLWHWDKKHGWVWIPGSAFAPAWVTWGTCDGARLFRPLSLWDWHFAYRRGFRYAGWPSWDPCAFYPNDQRVVVDLGTSAQQPAATPTPSPTDDGQTTPIRRQPERPLLPLPDDLEKLARRVAKAESQDQADVRAAVERAHESAGVVPRAELLPPVETPAGLGPIRGVAERFRDWNFDVRAARSVGGHIVYSSDTNTVRCEDCRRPLTRLDFGSFRAAGDPSRGSASSGSADGGSASSGASSSGSAGRAGDQGGRERIRDRD